MTFTTSLKEEITQNEYSLIEARYELEAFIKCIGKTKDNIVIILENAAVARKIYKDIKRVFGVNANITVRVQKRFRIKQIYILTIKDKVEFIKEAIDINNLNVHLETDEEKIAFLQGAFLAVGNISNPQTSGYHLEFICNNEILATTIKNLLIHFNLNAKIVERGYKSVVYLKASENISDLLKLFKATNSMFFFEDIRIYRDHKNMVNRLNNCELSNQTKTIATGMKQLEDINYLKDHDLFDILDEKMKIVVEAREKYPESSLAELAEIITLEYNYKIGKSGVNHHFIKMTNLVKRHRNNNEN